MTKISDLKDIITIIFIVMLLFYNRCATASDQALDADIYSPDQVEAILKIHADSTAFAINEIKKTCPLTSMLIHDDPVRDETQPLSKYKYLAEDIIEQYKLDQASRLMYDLHYGNQYMFDRMVAADKLSRRLIHNEITTFGFLGPEDIGSVAYGDSLILVAHANADHALQRNVLMFLNKYNDNVTDWNRQLIKEHIDSGDNGVDIAGPNKHPQIFNSKKDGLTIKCGLVETPISFLYVTLRADYNKLSGLPPVAATPPPPSVVK